MVLFNLQYGNYHTVLNKISMDRQQSDYKTSPINELDPENVLTGWINAVACFQLNYHQIYTIIHAHKLSGKMDAGANVNQCSISQLKTFLSGMQQQLETLLIDIDSSGLQLTQVNYQKLAAHTNSLELLNQQAQQLLVLTCLPAS
jgi:hypothetical protein